MQGARSHLSALSAIPSVRRLLLRFLFARARGHYCSCSGKLRSADRRFAIAVARRSQGDRADVHAGEAGDRRVAPADEARSTGEDPSKPMSIEALKPPVQSVVPSTTPTAGQQHGYVHVPLQGREYAKMITPDKGAGCWVGECTAAEDRQRPPPLFPLLFPSNRQMFVLPVYARLLRLPIGSKLTYDHGVSFHFYLFYG